MSDVLQKTVERDRDTGVGRPSRRRRKGLLWLTLGVVVVAGTGAGYWYLLRDSGADVTSEPIGPAATAQVIRETLSASESWGGTLGHGTPFAVTAGGDGTVTRVAAQARRSSRAPSCTG